MRDEEVKQLRTVKILEQSEPVRVTTEQRQCEKCGIPFLAQLSEIRKGKYCSPGCFHQARYGDEGGTVTVECLACRQLWQCPKSRLKYKPKYCSRACRRAYKTVSRTCKQCQKEFTVFASRSKERSSAFCSSDCYQRYLETSVELLCPVCEQTFVTTLDAVKRGKKVCSEQCRLMDWKRRGMSRICEICRCHFTVTPADARRHPTKYCSRACRGKAAQRRSEQRCRVCYKPISISVSKSADNRGKFCSRRCLHVFQTSERYWEEVLSRQGRNFYRPDFVHALKTSISVHCPFPGCDDARHTKGLWNPFGLCRRHAVRVYASLQGKRRKRQAILKREGLT